MKQLAVLVPLALWSGCMTEEAPDDSEDTAAFSGQQRLVAMTQNQYLGAELAAIITAPDQATYNAEVLEALAQVEANRFDDRVWALAVQILLTQPDVVGLQEVFRYARNGQLGAAPYRDHLADTLEALGHLGQHYVVAAQVQNLKTTIPVDEDSDGTIETHVDVLDRDVILVKEGLAATPVPYNLTCGRPSADGGPGCNYALVLSVPTVGGPLTIERGFVGIDVTVRGRDYRVVNTHLEVPDLDPTNPLSAIFQTAQAQQLVATLAATTPPDRTLVALGDFNSSPEDETVVVGDLILVTPYQQMVAAGHIDTWTLDERDRRGDTCCHAEDLRNARSTLIERIDLIFSTSMPERVRADVLGDREYEKFPIGLWPSDHGTVVGRLTF